MNTLSSNNFAGNPMMEALKTNLVTIMMFKSINHNGSSSQGGGMWEIIYVFLVTQMIDFIVKHLPAMVNKMVRYSEANLLQSNKLLNNMVNATLNEKEKVSSITIQINISDHENVFGQALLDYITNNDNTKHVSFKKQNFILNQNDIIEICDELFIKLKENHVPNEQDPKADIEQTVELFSYTKTMHELRDFLNKISHDYTIKIKNKLGDKIYYFNQHPINAPKSMNGEKDYTKLPNNCSFTMKMFQTNRKFSNLFGPEITVVKKRVEFFIKNKKWYDKKGIPYNLGLLLSGQPGSGKTSTIKCLANETKRHIININLNNDITKIQLENLFFNELITVLNIATCQTEKYHIPLDQRIYVLEDIDCQSDLVMDRSLKKEELWSNSTSGAEKIDLSFLLNLLDGVLEIPGRVVVMTSNYPKQLDHALIRPGRIDIIADFKKCDRKTLVEMIEFFYDIEMNETDKDMIHRLKDYLISPAEMSKLMFENFNDYKTTISILKSMGKNENKNENENENENHEYCI